MVVICRSVLHAEAFTILMLIANERSIFLRLKSLIYLSHSIMLLKDNQRVLFRRDYYFAIFARLKSLIHLSHSLMLLKDNHRVLFRRDYYMDKLYFAL